MDKLKEHYQYRHLSLPECTIKCNKFTTRLPESLPVKVHFLESQSTREIGQVEFSALIFARPNFQVHNKKLFYRRKRYRLGGSIVSYRRFKITLNILNF